MSNIFDQKWTKEDMLGADDSRWAPGSVQVPTDDLLSTVPDLYVKSKFPSSVVNVVRPRKGHDY